MTRLALLLALGLVATACAEAASTPAPAPDATPSDVAASPVASAVAAAPGIVPILASSELAVGKNRLLFGLTDASGALIAAPDVDVTVRTYDADDATPDVDEIVAESEARFLWAIEGQRGLYAADVTYPEAGRWGSRFMATFPDGREATVAVEYDVRETSSTPPLGAPAPAVDTPTAEDVGGDLAMISTDTEPLERLYERSIADVAETGGPAVIAFVTPAFCQTATCGPTLEKVKEAAVANPDVDFVHVEPYVMAMKDGRLQPVLDEGGRLQRAPWTIEWGLLSEPFVAVVDADGNVSAKFEGVITTEELEAAIDAL